jgi:hypothetical protein
VFEPTVASDVAYRAGPRQSTAKADPLDGHGFRSVLCSRRASFDPADLVVLRACKSAIGGCLTLNSLGVRARFGRRQRFTLAARGRAAEASYRATIAESRTRPGRHSFDAARAAWATSLELHPDDGVYLGAIESSAGASLTELVDALLDCGFHQADALGALGRLVDAGLVCAGADTRNASGPSEES